MDLSKYVTLIAVVPVCVAAVVIVKMILEYKERQIQRERDDFKHVMDTPLEKFSDTGAERLAQKYMDPGEPVPSGPHRLRQASRSGERDDSWSAVERVRSAPLINISINNISHSNNSSAEAYGDNARRQAVGRTVRSVGDYPQKSWLVAFGLCFFFGVIGVHNFYCGEIGMGLLYFFTGGLFGIGWIVDIFRIGFGSYRDRFGQPLR